MNSTQHDVDHDNNNTPQDIPNGTARHHTTRHNDTTCQATNDALYNCAQAPAPAPARHNAAQRIGYDTQEHTSARVRRVSLSTLLDNTVTADVATRATRNDNPNLKRESPVSGYITAPHHAARTQAGRRSCYLPYPVSPVTSPVAATRKYSRMV